MIDAPLVERFNRAEATLLTYTVDEPQEMKRLIALGIDGIITNRPALLEGVLSELFGPKRAP
jgi:glycerophosphoryl diester phosphodiesterase